MYILVCVYLCLYLYVYVLPFALPVIVQVRARQLRIETWSHKIPSISSRRGEGQWMTYHDVDDDDDDDDDDDGGGGGGNGISLNSIRHARPGQVMSGQAENPP